MSTITKWRIMASSTTAKTVTLRVCRGAGIAAKLNTALHVIRATLDNEDLGFPFHTLLLVFREDIF